MFTKLTQKTQKDAREDGGGQFRFTIIAKYVVIKLNNYQRNKVLSVETLCTVSTNTKTPREIYLSKLDLTGYLHFCQMWLICFISLQLVERHVLTFLEKVV